MERDISGRPFVPTKSAMLVFATENLNYMRNSDKLIFLLSSVSACVYNNIYIISTVYCDRRWRGWSSRHDQDHRF